MNTLTHAGQSFHFTTAEELSSIPIMRAFIEDPTLLEFRQGDGHLLAYKLIEGKPVMYVVGTLAQPIALPKVMRGAQSQGVKP